MDDLSRGGIRKGGIGDGGDAGGGGRGKGEGGDIYRGRVKASHYLLYSHIM